MQQERSGSAHEQTYRYIKAISINNNRKKLQWPQNWVQKDGLGRKKLLTSVQVPGGFLWDKIEGKTGDWDKLAVIKGWQLQRVGVRQISTVNNLEMHHHHMNMVLIYAIFQKYHISSSRSTDFVSIKPVENSIWNKDRCYTVSYYDTEQHKHSFFPRTTIA